MTGPPPEPITEAPPHRVRAIMRQTWRDLTFLHWPFDPAVIRPLIPAELTLDVYDGSAWIGLVPFMITGLILPGAPAVPWLSAFPETNVRTYVADAAGHRGVWFFSLDAARLPAVIGARSAYALPYFWARMSVRREGDTVHYLSHRLHGSRAAADIAVQIGQPIPEASELEVFLTARFRLFARRFGRILKADIEHRPWPLQRATVTAIEQTLTEAAGVPQTAGLPLVHFASRVDVLVAAPERAA